MVLPNVHNLGYKAGQGVYHLCSNHAALPEIPPFSEIWDFIRSLPMLYMDWWLNLVTKDPVHVFVETTLLISVVLMIVLQRSKDWREDNKEHLTEAEKEELLQQWKEHERHDLAPPLDENRRNDISSGVVVHANHGRTMEIREEDDDDHHGKLKTVLNFATLDFLGMASSSLLTENDGPGVAVKNASREALGHYGCGSCGPRGFYGTIQVHLDLEDKISKFTGTEGAIMYSDGASTVTSTVAAFAKRGDLLVVDDGVYEPLVTGISLSRANVEWFRHNDMNDLRCVLDKIKANDKRLGRKSNAQRRFIVVEGLYKNSGTIVPLDELVALKHEYCYRLIVDESFSFGTLGNTGRGVIEMANKQYMHDAEIVTISLENAMGSIGGVTVGNEEVVDHQRLSGAGYCFSASSPPFTASAAIQALAQLENRPELLGRLNENKEYLYEKLTTSMKGIIPETLLVTSDKRSPIVFLELADGNDNKDSTDINLLDDVAHECLQQGVAIVSTGRHTHVCASPSSALRLTVSAVHTLKDIDQCLTTLKAAVNKAKGGR